MGREQADWESCWEGLGHMGLPDLLTLGSGRRHMLLVSLSHFLSKIFITTTK